MGNSGLEKGFCGNLRVSFSQWLTRDPSALKAARQVSRVTSVVCYKFAVERHYSTLDDVDGHYCSLIGWPLMPYCKKITK